jgi:bifunctional UDP-N-acetylglucosamine pyrophosphorylase / glucosamine-1-phosphate N-acetyltransferase
MAIRLIILAAGKGTRMKSTLPKVLHRLAGKPLLGHVIDTGLSLNAQGITVVIGHGADQVKQTMTQPVQWAMQTEQLGTAHAVMQGLEGIEDDDTVLLTYGDVPLTRASTYQKMLDVVSDTQMGLLTLHMEDPTGYGRIIREGADGNGAVVGIVEQKDATPEQLAIKEGNCGVISIKGKWLLSLLKQIGNDNAQGEYYLTDLIGLAVANNVNVEAIHPEDAWETDGVNSRVQLATLERVHQNNQAIALMEGGVTLRDPARLDIRGTLTHGTDVDIDVNAVFEGVCHVGNNVTIGPNCLFSNAIIGDGTHIKANSVIEDSTIGQQGDIGPFARIRPGCELADGVKIGNFVEAKKAVIGNGSKVNHLSYVGDVEIAENVNVGAGTITCNYDGANKHKTIIGSGAFIGSNTALVAPVTIGEGATIGAGSTITKQAPSDKLTITRAKQTTIEGWQRPTKKS